MSRFPLICRYLRMGGRVGLELGCTSRAIEHDNKTTGELDINLSIEAGSTSDTYPQPKPFFPRPAYGPLYVTVIFEGRSRKEKAPHAGSYSNNAIAPCKSVLT